MDSKSKTASPAPAPRGGRFIVWRLSLSTTDTIEVGSFDDPVLALAALDDLRETYPQTATPSGIFDDEFGEAGDVEARLREAADESGS